MADRRRYILGSASDFQQVAADIEAAEAVDIEVVDIGVVDTEAVAADFRMRYTTR